MMKFILIADNEKLEKNFFPWWQVLVFISVIILIFIVIFPKNLFDKILKENRSSPAVLNYLQAYKHIYPNDPQIILNIIEQQINLGLLKAARENIAEIKANPKWKSADIINQLRFCNYLIIRHQAYQTKPNTKLRISYLQKLRNMTKELANAPLKPQQLQTIAHDSLAVAQSDLALKIYNHLFAINALTTSDELAEGGNIAMQNNSHLDSAKFYKAAYLKTSNLSEKKPYALEVIKVLWQAKLLNEALAYAQKLPEDLINDKETLLYLAQLAIAANRPDIAEEYALKALLIKADNHDE